MSVTQSKYDELALKVLPVGQRFPVAELRRRIANALGDEAWCVLQDDERIRVEIDGCRTARANHEDAVTKVKSGLVDLEYLRDSYAERTQRLLRVLNTLRKYINSDGEPDNHRKLWSELVTAHAAYEAGRDERPTETSLWTRLKSLVGG